jgi:hypothetical protein
MKKLRSAALVLTGCIVGLAAGLAQADVTIESSLSVEGVGAMAFTNMSGSSKTVISGERARTDSDMKMQSKIIGFLARNAVGPSAEIILLDQDKLVHLNMNKKEYTETTFEQFRAQMQKATDQMNSSGQRSQPSAIDQSKCEWLPAKASVNKSGEKAQFAGYDAQRVTITASQPCKDKETGAICEITLVVDEWTSPDFVVGAEARKFYTAYATKMGMDPSTSQDASQKAKMFFSQYKGAWTEIESKMQGVKGYPLKNSFTLAMGGAQCKDSSSDQTQSSQSSQSSDSPTGPGGLAGAMAGKLGSLFQKKKDNSDAPVAQPAPVGTPVALPPGDVALMTISSQLISVSTNAASADAFTVPAGFKKLEMKAQ